MTMRPKDPLALSTDPALALPGNVIAFAVPGRSGWRWRVVNGHGQQLEESEHNYGTIELALKDGRQRLYQLRTTKQPVRDPDVVRIVRRGG
jgi:hypothetical protein